MMAPRKLKDGKDIKMVQRAKNCNKEELANALGDAISSSIPEVPIDSKMNARVASETSDDQESCGSLESSLDSSSRFDPEEFRRALRKKPRRRSRESRLASISPRRKSRKVYPSSSSSELFSSDQEELPRKRRDRNRSSNSGRSGVKLQRQSSRQQSRDRRRSRSKKVSHTRKRSPPPRSSDRSNLSRQPSQHANRGAGRRSGWRFNTNKPPRAIQQARSRIHCGHPHQLPKPDPAVAQYLPKSYAP